MNIVITGASGFIGQHLMKFYLSKNDNVIAVVPNPEEIIFYKETYPNLTVISAKFEEYNRLSNILRIDNCDIFYYLAWDGYGNFTNDYTAQIKNIKPLCDAISESAKFNCKKFIFSTSFSEFMISESETKTHLEGAYCNVYGSTKHAARLIAQAVAAQCNIEFISVAFANTFGPGDKSKRSTNLFIYKLLKGEIIDLTEGVHLYDWNYIDDTINGLILAAEKGESDSVYYIGNNFRRPLKDIVYEVRECIAPNVEIKLGTYPEKFYVDYSCIDVHKLYRKTGYLAKWNFKDAIVKTAEWVKQLHWE